MSIPFSIEFKLEKGNAPLMLALDEKFLNLETKRKEAEDLGLNEKNEFHVTIIGNNSGKIILEHIDQLDESKKTMFIDELHNLCKSFNWEVYLLDEFYYIKKEYYQDTIGDLKGKIIEIRESVIQACKIPRLSVFYQQLNLLFKRKIKTPFPHITLCTNSTLEDKKLRGIGIDSKKLFKSLTPVKI